MTAARIPGLAALALFAAASAALAQQADPPGFNAALGYMAAPDGSRFQSLKADGTFDDVASASAMAAYISAHAMPLPAGPATVSKLGFIRLLNATERAAFIAAQDQASELTPTQEASPTSQQQALIGLKVFLMEYDALQPGDTINLQDPATVAAVNLLQTLGVVQSAARVSAILAGQAPSS